MAGPRHRPSETATSPRFVFTKRGTSKQRRGTFAPGSSSAETNYSFHPDRTTKFDHRISEGARRTSTKDRCEVSGLFFLIRPRGFGARALTLFATVGGKVVDIELETISERCCSSSGDIYCSRLLWCESRMSCRGSRSSRHNEVVLASKQLPVLVRGSRTLLQRQLPVPFSCLLHKSCLAFQGYPLLAALFLLAVICILSTGLLRLLIDFWLCCRTLRFRTAPGVCSRVSQLLDNIKLFGHCVAHLHVACFRATYLLFIVVQHLR